MLARPPSHSISHTLAFLPIYSPTCSPAIFLLTVYLVQGHLLPCVRIACASPPPTRSCLHAGPASTSPRLAALHLCLRCAPVTRLTRADAQLTAMALLDCNGPPCLDPQARPMRPPPASRASAPAPSEHGGPFPPPLSRTDFRSTGRAVLLSSPQAQKAQLARQWRAHNLKANVQSAGLVPPLGRLRR
ncbi:uncharacterized protein C8Q71DRAFT_785676 [Rhodofomes roseus]|uniref:Uncharacterized protein n=1 Tax=Rhodofomes roseus TaxID=34475 RepID=A0ABQ8K190_9APHY|nr:uncharacterized protein C8Q71DRAFT_785676 [Rhodofomes roseus]KAH9830426.1 hypothetical protein C8Q71DRAFT_785676 [Rhodofomes roseus]